MIARSPRFERGPQNRVFLGPSSDSAVPALHSFLRLRPYQREAVEVVLAAHARGERSGLVSLPTGAGKTVIAAEVLRALPGRALIVAHIALLGTQLRAALSEALGEPVGLVSDGSIDRGDARVVVALRQSLTPTRLSALSERTPFEIVVIDEAHHAAVDSSYLCLVDSLRLRSPDLIILGLTATPWREQGRLLFERWWFSREIADLIPLGVLAPVRSARVSLPMTLRGVRVRGGDYALAALEPALLAVVDATAERVAPLLDGLRHVVVFSASVAHAQALSCALERHGVTAACIWGAMPLADRDRTLGRWRAGEIVAFVNVGIVVEGFDEPRISAIVFARPTASTLFYVQALGRGLRTAPGKRDCLVVDCVGASDLPDARQCTLDMIVPDVSMLGGLIDERAPYRGRRLVGAPSEDAARRWLRIAPDLFVLSIERRELIFVQRDRSTGLYRALLVSHGRIEELVVAPFPVVVTSLRERFHRQRLVFAARTARWRQKPATAAQQHRLMQLSPIVAAQALRERWSRGRVADSITIAIARRLAFRLGLLTSEAA